ncbi:MAG TPA: GNAT family N-acetyltransferase [Nocardioidaceae bacterium]|nr:GNAT family N-acetyltransferase [Nocardioidaceae bacterium]
MTPDRADVHVPVLTDGVVTLRAHHRGDVDGVEEQGSDPVSQRWTTVPVPYSRADAERFVTEVVPEGWSRGGWAFAVEAPDAEGRPRFCGTVELRDEGNRRAEVAYGAHPWARGRGILLRALHLLLEWGFTEQRLRTVIWWANTGNWASRRVAWRLGFSCDGTLERWLPQRGDLLDAWVGVLHVDGARAPRHDWLEPPSLVGEGVALRPLRDEDAARVAEACDDALTARWLDGLPSPYTVQDAHAYLQHTREQHASATGMHWALVEPGSDELVGCISLTSLVPGREAEVGYWLHPRARGRGLMTEACGMVARQSLAGRDVGGLGLHRLTVAAAEGNAGSLRVIEANGFTLVGRERQALRLRDGRPVDALRYDVLADEYAASG